MRVLPPGVGDRTFGRAIDAFRAAVGHKWVLTDPGDLAAYQDPCAIADGFTAGAAVLPASVPEIQQVLAAATEYGVPLSPVSTGRNLGYGGPAPRLSGAVVLDLRRMNRILEVNETLGYAVVEPGVTFMDLAAYLAEHDSGYWVDVPDLGWGSVLGNTLERGVGYTPYGDHLSIQCGMEVVLPTGEVVRTGMGGLPGSSTWHLFKYGYGPVYDGMFTQSNFGVVTRMGVWLLPRPPAYRPYLVTLPREEDLGAFVEILRPLRMNGTITNVPTLRSVLLDAAAVRPRSFYHDGPGPVPDSVVERIMADQKLGRWNFYGAMYGTEAAVDAQEETLRDAFAAIPGARFHLPDEHDGPVFATRAKIMSGRPNLETAQILQWVDNGGHIDFAPVSPATGEDALRQYAMVRDRAHEHGKDYLGTFIVGRREMHHICLMMFDTKDPDDRRRTLDLCTRLIDEGAAQGYGVYRAHPALMDHVAATFAANDHSLLRLSEKIKDAVDPAGILSPGKQGIWPGRLRDGHGTGTSPAVSR